MQEILLILSNIKPAEVIDASSVDRPDWKKKRA